MNFPLKSKPKKNYDLRIIVAVCLFLFLSVTAYIFPTFFSGASHVAMKPMWFFKDKTISTFSYFSHFFYLKSSLIKENQLLKDELGNLRLNKIDYEVLFKENEELRAKMGMKSTKAKLISNILSKPPQSRFDTFVISNGSKDGINVGNLVYISDSVVVGKISDVYDTTAIVKLFSTSGEIHEATLSRTGATFVLNGSGGANFQIELPKDVDIVWGDSLIYPGEKDSIMATVYFVDTNSQSSFKTIYLRIPGNVFQSKRVLVDLGGDVTN